MEDFIAELENNLSRIGAGKVWKRQIGSTLLWMSPITLSGQEKVNEVLSNSDALGMNVVNETKRVTLAHAIVGINDLDLREYRDNVPRFPYKGKDGKVIKVSLDKYIYTKMQDWSSQFIDDAFSIYADLLETDQKENLKDIKFENAVSPTDELMDLEKRVGEIRQQLNLPMLIESVAVENSEMNKTESLAADIKNADSKPVIEIDFDPFAKVVSNIAKSVPEEPARVVKEHSPQPPPVAPVINPPESAAPVKGPKMIDVEQVIPYAASPNVNSEVIDRPAEKVNTPPVIDPSVVNRNPRFSPPSR